MFGRKKKDKELKDRKTSGVKHGLGFSQNETTWTIGLNGDSNILIIGSDRIAAADKIIKSLRDLDGSVTILSNAKASSSDDSITTMSSLAKDGKPYDDVTGARMLEDVITGLISSDVMSSINGDGTAGNDHNSDVARNVIVIDGWESVLRREDDGHYDNNNGASDGDNETSGADGIIDSVHASGIWSAAEQLADEVLEPDEYNSVVSYVDASGAVELFNDAISAGLTGIIAPDAIVPVSRAILLSALVLVHEMSAGNGSLTLEAIDRRIGSVVTYPIALLLSQGADESLDTFAGRVKNSPLARSVASAWMRADGQTGLSITPSGWPRDVERACNIIESDYDMMPGLSVDSRRLVTALITLAATASDHEIRVIIIASGVSPVLMGLLSRTQVRVTAGALRNEDRWLAGSDIGRIPVNPRAGVVTVFSRGVQSMGIGRSLMSPSSMISPEFFLDRLDIRIV